MLRIDRICAVLFILAFALLVPCVKLVTFIDELIAGILGIIAITDCIVNQSWRRYTLLWIIIGIMTFYAIYSITAVSYNTFTAIATDWIIQLKPFVPFIVFLAVRPVLSVKQKKWLRYIAIVNAVICTFSFFLPKEIFLQVMGHISYPGTVLLICAIVYAYTAEKNKLRITDTAIIIAMLTAGLLCGRSKYYGELVVSLFFLFIYTNIGYRKISLKNKILIFLIPILVAAVGWSKFKYYFLSGESSTAFDPEMMESYARPVLYATGALIFIDHIPFGSGLASFCSWASIDPYSSVYYDYGISKVYGLSPSNPYFICDAFYPSLAQFGFAGVILFASFWVYVTRLLKKVVRSNPEYNKLPFAIGWIIIIAMMIESIASTTFVQTSGMCAMMLLGIICSKANTVQQINDLDNE